ncbi:MAG: class I SAM-dependent methyltransferase [Acidobacteriota bacterium]
MLHALIEKLSNQPGLFLFCRSILEADFKVIRKVIRERLPASPGRKILDIACGPGAFSDLFTAETYWGIDINERYIQYARRRYRGTFKVMDARKLDFEDASFDDALIFGLLHHLSDEDATAVLAGVARVLKPGGRALIIEDVPTESRLNLIGHVLHWVENGHYIRPAEHYRRLLEPYSRFEGERLFRSGICDYYMASLLLDGSSRTAAPRGSRAMGAATAGR